MSAEGGRSTAEELKDLDLKDTGSRRRWELMLVTAISLTALFGAYQLLQRLTGFSVGAVERWKARHPREERQG